MGVALGQRFQHQGCIHVLLVDEPPQVIFQPGQLTALGLSEGVLQVKHLRLATQLAIGIQEMLGCVIVPRSPCRPGCQQVGPEAVGPNLQAVCQVRPRRGQLASFQVLLGSTKVVFRPELPGGNVNSQPKNWQQERDQQPPPANRRRFRLCRPGFFLAHATAPLEHSRH